MCSSAIANALPLLGKQLCRVKSMTKRNVQKWWGKTRSLSQQRDQSLPCWVGKITRRPDGQILRREEWLNNVAWHPFVCTTNLPSQSRFIFLRSHKLLDHAIDERILKICTPKCKQVEFIGEAECLIMLWHDEGAQMKVKKCKCAAAGRDVT